MQRILLKVNRLEVTNPVTITPYPAKLLDISWQYHSINDTVKEKTNLHI